MMFAPFEALAEKLLPHAVDSSDGAHDAAHIGRVFTNALAIHRVEGGDGELLAAAVLLHDCVAVEKSSPLRAQASRLAARKASGLLRDLQWDEMRIEATAHAIEAHSFSAGMAPETIEAQILQDADRLDAIGMIGVARCFYTAGRMNSLLYQPDDPAAKVRPLDDRAYSLDHFPAKLFKLADGFNTATGRSMAAERHRSLTEFYRQMLEEIGA